MIPDDAHVVRTRVGPWVLTAAWPAGAEQGGPRWLQLAPDTRAPEEDVIGGLSSTVLRQVDFQGLSDSWRESRDFRRDVESQIPSVEAALRMSLGKVLDQGVSDEYLARLSSAYVELVRSGEKSVTAKLGELTEKRPETIRAHLKEARKREMLTTVRGKAGGQLTDKATDILDINSRRYLGNQ